MCLESLHCSPHLPSLIFFLNQGLQVVLMSEVALMRLDLLPATPGEDLALYFFLLSLCFLEQNSHQCHQGKLFLATPLILVDLQQIHGTIN